MNLTFSITPLHTSYPTHSLSVCIATHTTNLLACLPGCHLLLHRSSVKAKGSLAFPPSREVSQRRRGKLIWGDDKTHPFPRMENISFPSKGDLHRFLTRIKRARNIVKCFYSGFWYNHQYITWNGQASSSLCHSHVSYTRIESALSRPRLSRAFGLSHSRFGASILVISACIVARARSRLINRKPKYIHPEFLIETSINRSSTFINIY